jgi:hypothetical protein
MQPSPILPLRALRPIRLLTPATWMDRGPAGSPTRTVIESNWSSGRPATPMASPRRTFPLALELSSGDLVAIANTPADYNGHCPDAAEAAFWTADTGIDA